MARNGTSTQAIERSAANQVQVREQQPAQQQQVQQSRWTFTPTVDIWDTGQAWVLIADVPGADAEKISITCEEDTLTLHAPVQPRWPQQRMQRCGEYQIGDYQRTFRIGEDVDVDGISAEYSGGVLKVHLPRTARAQARKIPITTR